MTPQTRRQAGSDSRAPAGTSSIATHWEGEQLVRQLGEFGASPSTAETFVLLTVMVVLHAITVWRRT